MNTPAPAGGPSHARAGALLAGLAIAAGLIPIAGLLLLRLPAEAQLILALVTALAAAILHAGRGRVATLAIAALSAVMTGRYLLWRLLDTIPDSGLARALGIGLLLAELYAGAMLVGGFIQGAWPLRRRIRALPADPAAWPDVDVFVTTKDEDLSVLRVTLLAARGLDWPPDRLAVWLLDDGDRPACRALAEALGAKYLARPDRRGAKAGNLNHGLRHSHAAFLAVFDADDVPTRAFLQLTLGWLVADPTLAFVQTPHHAYAPEPAQRNLPGMADAPAEGALFHGPLQDGADTGGAAMFSGSCAVLRREALTGIGGFAEATLTEDAHTSLRLHRAGWGSAFLGVPLAAGQAPPSLAAHIQQRARWARGMMQIMRRESPLFAGGLSLFQRLCYLRSCLHFLFPLPRLVFLTAPLALLLADQAVIAATPETLIAYALPHLGLAVAAASRLSGAARVPFLGGLYEAIAMPGLLRPSLGGLLRPRVGRFVTTPKHAGAGGRFDRRSVRPHLLIGALLVAGLLRGAVLLAGAAEDDRILALAINLAWAALSLVTLLTAVAAARERGPAQWRPRLRTDLAVSLATTGGDTSGATARALSTRGATLGLPEPLAIPAGEEVRVTFTVTGEALTLPAVVERTDGRELALVWEPETLQAEAALVRALFGRADAWLPRAPSPVATPLDGLRRRGLAIAGLWARRVAVGAGLLALVLPAAMAQGERNQGRGAHPPTVVRTEPPPEPPISLPSPGDLAPAAPPPMAAPAAPAALENRQRQVVLSLRQLAGSAGALAFHGTSDHVVIEVGVRSDEVVTAAQLDLAGSLSPALLPEGSGLAVLLNDQLVGNVPARSDQPDFSASMPVQASLFHDTNRLELRFSGRYAPDCNDPLSSLLWATLADTSTLTLTLQRLPPQRDLSRLPLPFFDAHDRAALAMPIVLPDAPGNDAMRAAAIVASWLGAQASARGAAFTAAADIPAQGNAVVLQVGSEGRAIPGLAPPDGPTLAVLPNPHDPLGSLLVVAGRNGAEAVAAATALAVGNRSLGGAQAVVRAPVVGHRVPYDAPAWVPADRPVRLGELVDPASLQSAGYTGLLQVPFRTAPDLVTWRDRPLKLDLRFRAPPAPILDPPPSRLDVGINGLYLGSVPLAGRPAGWLESLFGASGQEAQSQTARIGLPVGDLRGGNTLEFFFDARPMRRGECLGVPDDLRMAIDPDSVLDLRRGVRFARMPNLGFFQESGFPFTRYADLSETVAVLPDRPSLPELSAFLTLIGRLGAQTGAPALQIGVVRPAGAAALEDRDLLLVGTIDHLAGTADILSRSPATVSGGRLGLRLPSALETARGWLGGGADPDERARAQVALTASFGADGAALVGGESGLEAGRSVVALLAARPEALVAAANTLGDAEQGKSVAGDLALFGGGRVTSYAAGPRYSVGSVPPWMWPDMLLRDHPIAAALIGVCVALLVAAGAAGLARRSAGRRLSR